MQSRSHDGLYMEVKFVTVHSAVGDMLTYPYAQ